VQAIHQFSKSLTMLNLETACELFNLLYSNRLWLVILYFINKR